MKKLLMAVMAAAVLDAQAAGAPTEAEKQANCRKANAEAVETLRRIPASSPRDKASKDKLEAKIVKTIDDNRKNGVDECTTWGQVMGLAFTQ